MSEQKNTNPFVNLIKKAVGLPTGSSSCCNPAPAAPAAGDKEPPAPAKGGCCG
ncbi:MAG TPA: hypothetical protein VD973_14000 [Symbiobacteriaceae bacterium]|nr:hypothetical protein [Symbiobacteriaceae bacterium]